MNHNLCIQCHDRPKHHGHKFCGKTCADKHSSGSSYQPKCKNCHMKPKNQGFDFCSFSCGQEYKSKSKSSYSSASPAGKKQWNNSSSSAAAPFSHHQQEPDPSLPVWLRSQPFVTDLEKHPLGPIPCFHTGYQFTDHRRELERRFDAQKTIFFYEKDRPYYEFTNFFIAPFLADDGFGHLVEWVTTEHYFQAHKLPTAALRNQLRTTCKIPKQAFDFTRQSHLANKIPATWHSDKLDVMRRALVYKFTQHPDLADLLLRTEGFQLVEDSHRDSEWGVGEDGRGNNILGELLMKLRDGDILEFYHSNNNTPSKKKKCSFEVCTRDCEPGRIFCSIEHELISRRAELQKL